MTASQSDRTPPYDPREIANFLLDEAEKLGVPLTNLVINKLIYFCHGWHLAIKGAPLQREAFEAWELGPVLRSVYGEFHHFRHQPIDSRATRLDLRTGGRIVIVPELDEDTEEFVKYIFSGYHRLTAWQLVALSHEKGGPWDCVMSAVKSRGAISRIEDSKIAAFFLTRKGNGIQ